MTSRATWPVFLLGAAAAVVIAAHLSAQQQPTELLLPLHTFDSPEDTRKAGTMPEDIKAGVRPDYTRLRERLVVVPVRGQVSLIGGAGGNIAMQVGPQGVVLVDTGAPEAAEKVIAAYKAATAQPLRLIINTSADADHTGANEAVEKTGVGGTTGPRGVGGGGNPGPNAPGATPIVAFEAVLDRMSAPTGGQARPINAWPSSTFFTSKKTLHVNNEAIEILHQPAAHTDGDVIVHFRQSDVIAAGDVLSTDRFPHFDAAKGGSLQGSIDALNRIIDITVPQYNMQGGTLVIPGHGRIVNEADVVEVRDMATIVRDRVKAMVDKRMSLAQVKAARPTREYDAWYGSTTGSWTTDQFLEAVYKELSAPPATTRSSR